jgi:NADH-quinone oxidoreductase subunit B
MTPLELGLTVGRRWSLSVFNLGLACCAIEFLAATASIHGLHEQGIEPFAGPGEAQLLVVSGTVTAAMGAGIRAAYDGMNPATRHVLAFGACANTGGPYWDSYSVISGVSEIVPVDVFVPGCPPRPEALLEGLRTLDRALSARASATHPASA